MTALLRNYLLSFAALVGCGVLAAPAWAQEDAAEEAPADESGSELSAQEQLQALVEEGQKQFNEGEYDAAAESFTTVVDAFERAGAYAPGPLLFRAKAFAKLEDYEGAINDLKKAFQYAQTQPQIIPEIQSTRGEVYMALEAWQAALPDVQAAAQANRSNAQYQFDLGKVLVKLGGAEPGEKALTRYLDAIAAMEELPEGEDLQQAEALRLRAQAYGSLKKFEQAQADLAASQELDPENYEAFFTKAQIALIDKDYATGAEALEQAIATYKPKDETDTLPFTQGYLTLASVYEEAGKEAARDGEAEKAAEFYGKSRQVCVDLLAKLPEDNEQLARVRVATQFRQGVAERMTGDLAEAVKSFTKVIQLDPNQGEAYFRRGVCFHYLGEELLAIRDFEQSAGISYDSPRANLWKGMSWAKLGDYTEAIRAYGESIAVSDRYTPAYVNRSLAHMAQGNYRKAVNDLNEAIRLEPTNAMHYFRRGKAEALAGLRDKAIQSYMNAIVFDEKLKPAYDSLSTELTAAGQSALASEYRKRAAQLGL